MKEIFDDFREGLASFDYYFWLGMNDVKARYRRSVLGQIWITASVGIFVFAIGLFYSGIMGVDGAEYLPGLAVGYVIWYTIANTLNGAASIFIEMGPLLLQTKVPLLAITMRMVVRELFVLAHNLPILLIVFLIFGVWPDAQTLMLFVVAVLLVTLFGNLFALVIGVASARFRDIPPIMTSVTTILFFMTPVIWRVQDVPPETSFVYMLNPAAALIEMVRSPLLDRPLETWIFVNLIVTTIVMIVLASVALFSARKRITSWL